MAFLLSSSVITYLGIFGILNSVPVSSKANLDTLRLTQVIFRHGARTIDQALPTDPYKNESFWPPGYSQLTNQGKLQGYDLGLFLRERYDGFVKDTYDTKEVYAQSSDLARTIQTAYSVMAGFFLPNQLETVDNETDYLANNNLVEIPLPWKSVPIHTVPVDDDNVLRQKPEICPRWQQLYQNLQNEFPEMKTVYQDSRDISEFIYNHTGVYLSKMKDLLENVDTLYLEQFYNMTVSDWVTQLVSSEKATNFFRAYFEMITYTDEMKRLRAGPLLEKLVQNMVLNETSLKDEFDRSRNGQKKIYFFAAHDHTVAGLLNALGVFNKERPPFTAAVMLELHQPSTSNGISHQDFFVEIHYRNETMPEPYQLEFPGCGLRCPLPDFIRLAETYIPENWNLECQALTEANSLSTGWIVLIVLCVWVVLFIVFQFCLQSTCLGVFSKRRRQNAYSDLK